MLWNREAFFQIAIRIKCTYSPRNMIWFTHFNSGWKWGRREQSKETPRDCWCGFVAASCSECWHSFKTGKRCQRQPVDCWMNIYSANNAVLESVFAQLPHKFSMGKSHNACISDFMNLAFSFWQKISYSTGFDSLLHEGVVPKALTLVATIQTSEI